MATDLGKAYVQIIPSARGISGMISNELGGEAMSAGTQSGSKLGGALVGMAKRVIGAAAIGKFIKDSIFQGGQLEQSLGGVETLFKDSSDKVKQYAAKAFETSGISANEYMQNVTSFSASLLQSLGGNTSKAADVADMAMRDMSDNANKFGSDMESIQNAYQGFAKDNYTMLDNLKLGYGGTKSEMQRLLADATKLTGVKYDINNLSDVYNAIHAIQGKLDITGTTAKEASETLEGSFNSMKAAFKDFQGALTTGGDINATLSNLVQTTGTFLFKNLVPMVGKLVGNLGLVILQGIPKLINALNPAIDQIFTWLKSNFPRILQQGSELVGNLILGIINAQPELLSAAGNLLNSFVQFVLSNLPAIWETGKSLFFKLVDGIINVLPQIGETALKIITEFINYVTNNLPQILQSGIKILTELVNGIIQRLPMIGATVLKIAALFLATLLEKLPDILAMGVKLIVFLVKGIVSMFSNVQNAMNNLGSSIIQAVKKVNLFSAGKAIIDGFLRGLKSAFEHVKSFVGGIGTWIQNHKGPLSYDKKLLIPAGNAIMGGLYEGLDDGFSNVQSLVNSMAPQIQSGFNLEDYRVNSTGSNYNDLTGLTNNDNNQKPIEITVVSELDGREISRGTYRYDKEFMERETKINNRRRGVY
jgi:phage-related protein